MEKLEIMDNVFCNTFSGEGKTKYGYNIITIYDKKKALIIDTAFIEQSICVKSDLENLGVKPEWVIISYYHPDHITGSRIFKDCKFIGSEHYLQSIEITPENKHLVPEIQIKDDENFNFGSFSLKFLYTPGHSKCSITTVLNDEVAQIGDLIMYADNGKPTLPTVCNDSQFEEHIESLIRIKKLNLEKLILAHGKVIDGKEKIIREIDDRIYYLEKVLESKGRLDISQSLNQPIENYECLEWHKINTKRFFD